jgi:hypothetical protein
VLLQELDDVGFAVHESFLALQPAAVGMPAACARTVREQPLRSPSVSVGHCETQHEVESVRRQLAARLALGRRAPLVGGAAARGFRPEHLEPVRVVVHDRRVVERLRVERLGAALEQQRHELVRAFVRRLDALPERDHAGHDRERIVPVVVPARIRVGTAVEQRARDLHRARGAARQAHVREIQKRRPLEWTAGARRALGIGRETAFDLLEVTRGDRGVEIDLRDPGMLRKEPRGNRMVAAKERMPKDLVGDFLERRGRSVERFEQRWPACDPAFARERMLDGAQGEAALVLG